MNPKLKVIEYPMQTLIDQARVLGYDYNPEVSKYDQCLKIKDWMAYKYNIYTWVVPQSDFTFTPYYRDLRQPRNHKKKYAFSEYHNQATIEGLLFAIGAIE